MRSLFLALLLLSAPAFAATLTLTTTAAQDTKLERTRVRFNKETCASVALPAACSQAEARTAYCLQTVNNAVTNCPGAGKLDVYADVAAFLQGVVVKLVADTWGPSNDAADAAAFQAALAAATTAQKNGVCAALGLANGCMP